jgi:SAM-dependent methyltransferase
MILKNVNTNRQWDHLLGDEVYLADFPPITEKRIQKAYDWGKSCRTFLNIGSGQGFLERKFVEEKYDIRDKWVSLDISRVGLNVIRKKYFVKTLYGNITDIKLDGNKFECVYCMELLEHVNKLFVYKVYENIKRISKLNTRIVISVPVFEPVPMKNNHVGHVRKYTPYIIENELKRNNFKILEIKYLYAFKKNYRIKDYFCIFGKFRRPNVAMYLCQIK